MVKTPPSARPSVLRATDQHAKALGVILAEEFGEPASFQDARTGALLGCSPVETLPHARPPPEAVELAAGGQARVTTLPDGAYRVSLPLYAAGQPILVGTLTLRATACQDADAAVEARRLAKWAQSVCERLRVSDYLLSRERGVEEESAQAKTAWEAILRLDHLLRHLRAHKNQD